jgi:hypothetical protein
MTDHLEAIRVALTPTAGPEIRAAGIAACRLILAALESEQTPSARLPVAEIVSALRGLPTDKLLDLAIARLRAALPAGAAAEVQPFKLPIVPIPGRTGS